MIELNKKTQQDFLNREWVQKLLDAGVDMSDAKYGLIHNPYFHSDSVYYFNEGVKSKYYINGRMVTDILPTYTVSELLYKLHEWIYPTIDGKKFHGGLTFIKDAPVYMFYYNLHSENYDPRKLSNEHPKEWDESFMGECEYPIESLACLLIQCHKRDIGIKDEKGNQVSDTGNISDK